MSELYSLNLSPRYAANWGAWEVAREIICNALDADEKSMKVESPNANKLVVTTTTEPDIAELFIMGHGIKAEGGETVGQFGEGAKLAALVATRTQGSALKVYVPGKCVHFQFADAMGTEVLHAMVKHDSTLKTGCRTEIEMPGVGHVVNGKILSDRSDGPHPRTGATGSYNLFVKGIFITGIKEDSIWDWSLNNVPLNRDRNMVQTWDAMYRIGIWLGKHLTPDMAEMMIRSPEGVENNEAIEYAKTPHAILIYKDAFYRVHGLDAVLSLGADQDAYAKAHGIKCVSLPPASRDFLARAGVKTSMDVKPKGPNLQAVPTDPYETQIKWLRSFDNLIAAPPASLRVFQNDEVTSLGYTEFDERRIWINERLFADGSALELVRTYLHEMAHLMSESGDATQKFEDSLDYIIGRLALAVSTKKAEEVKA